MLLKMSLFFFFLYFLVYLIRKRWLNVDLSFPWFVSLIILVLASTSESFIQSAASLLGIIYSPLVIILITLFIFLGIITVLGIYITELRRRQILIIRKLAKHDLHEQEAGSI